MWKKVDKAETLNNIDTKPVLKNLNGKGVKLFAIYGQQYRIFSPVQINEMTEILGKNNFSGINNCSHYLFVDLQETFIDNIRKWLK